MASYQGPPSTHLEKLANWVTPHSSPSSKVELFYNLPPCLRFGARPQVISNTLFAICLHPATLSWLWQCITSRRTSNFKGDSHSSCSKGIPSLLSLPEFIIPSLLVIVNSYLVISLVLQKMPIYIYWNSSTSSGIICSVVAYCTV